MVYCVQSLETLGRLQEVNGYVRLTLNKLPGICGDLVRTEPNGKTGHSQIWLKHCLLGLKEILLNQRQAAKGEMHQGLIRPIKQIRNLEDVYRFYRTRNCVLTAQVVVIGHLSVEVSRPAKTVTDIITPHYVTNLRPL